MRTIAIAPGATFHAAAMASSFLELGAQAITVYSSVPRYRFRGLPGRASLRLVPLPFLLLERFTRLPLTRYFGENDRIFYDRCVAAILPKRCALFCGWAGMSLTAGRQVKRHGGTYVLDRACPFMEFQQNLMREECETTGSKFRPGSELDRSQQIQEYNEADLILVPSEYSKRSFPAQYQHKIIKAPLMGRVASSEKAGTESPCRPSNDRFTVGVVGGHPLRKGYYYLLQAWKKMRLQNARLLLRTSPDFSEYPAIDALFRELADVETVAYLPDIAQFYRSCDMFVLPSVDDGFGMALFEAMSFGVPCIATTNCGASELIENNRDGIVVSPRDCDALAAAMETLYASPLLRTKIGQQGRARVRQIGSSLYTSNLAQVLQRTPSISSNDTAEQPA